MDIKVLASFGLRNSIYEMEYFYKKFMESYIKEQKQHKNMNELNFLLSAFLNKYQTLKDVYPRIGKAKSWEDFNDGRKERLFLKPIRNVFTHQGDMLINTCVENEFFIGGPIYIIDKDKIKELKVEEASVNNIIRVFFKELIEEIKLEIENDEIDLDFKISDKNIKELTFKSDIIPEFVKKMAMDIQNFPDNPKNLKNEFLDYLDNLYKNI